MANLSGRIMAMILLLTSNMEEDGEMKAGAIMKISPTGTGTIQEDSRECMEIIGQTTSQAVIQTGAIMVTVTEMKDTAIPETGMNTAGTDGMTGEMTTSVHATTGTMTAEMMITVRAPTIGTMTAAVTGMMKKGTAPMTVTRTVIQAGVMTATKIVLTMSVLAKIAMSAAIMTTTGVKEGGPSLTVTLAPAKTGIRR